MILRVKSVAEVRDRMTDAKILYLPFAITHSAIFKHRSLQHLTVLVLRRVAEFVAVIKRCADEYR